MRHLLILLTLLLLTNSTQAYPPKPRTINRPLLDQLYDLAARKQNGSQP